MCVSTSFPCIPPWHCMAYSFMAAVLFPLLGCCGQCCHEDPHSSFVSSLRSCQTQYFTLALVVYERCSLSTSCQHLPAFLIRQWYWAMRSIWSQPGCSFSWWLMMLGIRSCVLERSFTSCLEPPRPMVNLYRMNFSTTRIPYMYQTKVPHWTSALQIIFSCY